MVPVRLARVWKKPVAELRKEEKKKKIPHFRGRVEFATGVVRYVKKLIKTHCENGHSAQTLAF